MIVYRAYYSILDKDREAHGQVTPGETNMDDNNNEESRAFQKQVDTMIADREVAAGDDEIDDEVDPEAVESGNAVTSI